MAEPKYTTQKHREWMTIQVTKIISDIEHIKELNESQEEHLSKLNNRVSKSESKISVMQGIGTGIAFLFTALFSLFIKE
jgi:demethoxyubiquinone hydroxylase (CLK1/Coq7/Cat5 family)